MNFLELLYSLEPRVTMAVVIGISIALNALTSNVITSSRRWTLRGDRLGRFTLWSSTSRVMRVLNEIARWIYFLVVPWATLMLSWNTTRALGIWRMEWLNTALWFVGLGIGGIIAVFWVWRPYAHTVHPHAIDETGWTWARQIVESLYLQTHWAFYRSGAILWLGDFYWGSFFGLILVMLEAWSNPRTRANVAEVTRADAPLWNLSLAVVSVVIFIVTQNSWYCLAVHLALTLGVRGVIGFPRVHT